MKFQFLFSSLFFSIVTGQPQGTQSSIPFKENSDTKISQTLKSNWPSMHPCDSKTPITIRIAEKDFINISINQILKNSEVVPLEYNQQSILSDFATFLNDTTNYFLVDKHVKKKVYQFSLNGQFIRTIGQYGEGQGEYQHLTDALVTPGGIEILSSQHQSQVFSYDKLGRFIESNQVLDRPAYSFIKDAENGFYYFKSSSYQNIIQKVNVDLQLIDSSVTNNTKLVPSLIKAFSKSSSGPMLFYQPFDNRIFGVDRDSIRIRYRLDFGQWTPNYNELDQFGQQEIMGNGEFWVIYETLENSQWLYLLIAKQVANNEALSKYYSLLYEKNTGKLYSLPDTPEPGSLFYPAFELGENMVLYTAVSPAIISKYEEWISEFTKRSLTINPSGNLIVVKVPIKKLMID